MKVIPDMRRVYLIRYLHFSDDTHLEWSTERIVISNKTTSNDTPLDETTQKVTTSGDTHLVVIIEKSISVGSLYELSPERGLAQNDT
jgi:hypothetical protein